MTYIRIEDEILDYTTNKCIYVIRDSSKESENCYVSYHWDNWRKYFLIDYQNCILFSYNSAQRFISDLIEENLNYSYLVIELSPYYKDCKQADTIEELCDGFIGITTKEYPNRPDIEPFIHYFQKPFEFMYGNNIIKHLKLIDVELKNQNGWSYPTKEWFETCDIYGFIRTSKGLIYVAKMNERGELELI